MIAGGETLYGWTVTEDDGSVRLRFSDIDGGGEDYWMEPEDAVDIGTALLQAAQP